MYIILNNNFFSHIGLRSLSTTGNCYSKQTETNSVEDGKYVLPSVKTKVPGPKSLVCMIKKNNYQNY